MNRAPIVGLKRFRFDDWRCGFSHAYGPQKTLRRRVQTRSPSRRREPRAKQELAEVLACPRAKVAYLEKSGPCRRRSHETRAKHRRTTWAARRSSPDINRSPNLGQQKQLIAILAERLPAGATPIPHSDMGWQYQHGGGVARQARMPRHMPVDGAARATA